MRSIRMGHHAYSWYSRYSGTRYSGQRYSGCRGYELVLATRYRHDDDTRWCSCSRTPSRAAPATSQLAAAVRLPPFAEEEGQELGVVVTVPREACACHRSCWHSCCSR